MIAWLRQFHSRIVRLDVDQIIWRSRLEHIVYEMGNLADHRNHQMYDVVHRELQDHVAYGLCRGFIPYNLAKSNKKLLKIK